MTPRARITALILLAGVMVGVVTPIRRLADASTYVLMSDSLWSDRDLTYAPADLARAQALQFEDLPAGLFLIRHGDRYVYGKPFAYPAAAAPFYALFGVRGFMVLNGVLLAALVLLGADVLAHRLGWRTALPISAVVFGFTVTPAYLYWIDPFLFCSVLVAGAVAACRRDRPLVAAVLLALLASCRAPYAAVALGPIVLYALSGQWRSLARFAAGLVIAGILLAGIQRATSGGWVSYTGQRFFYLSAFPYQGGADEPEVGHRSAIEHIGLPWPGIAELARRNAYFFVGRFAGIAAYFPTLLACCLWSRGWSREKSAWLLGFAATCETLLLAIPQNPYGGRHALGNRIFVLLPLALVAVDFIAVQRWRAAISAALLWMAVPILEMPFFLSLYPGRQMLEVPFRYLPFDWQTVPTVSFPFQFPGIGALTANQYYWEGDGFWTRGGTTAEFALFRRSNELPRLRLRSFLPRPRVFDGDVLLPLEWPPDGELEVTLSHPVARAADEHRPDIEFAVYRLRIATDDGTPASSVGRRDDNRYVGVFVRPILAPANRP